MTHRGSPQIDYLVFFPLAAGLLASALRLPFPPWAPAKLEQPDYALICSGCIHLIKIMVDKTCLHRVLALELNSPQTLSSSPASSSSATAASSGAVLSKTGSLATLSLSSALVSTSVKPTPAATACTRKPSSASHCDGSRGDVWMGV